MSILSHLRRLFGPKRHIERKAEEAFSLYWEYDNIIHDSHIVTKELTQLCNQTREAIRARKPKEVPVGQMENVQDKLMCLELRMGILKSAADGSQPGHYVNQMRESIGRKYGASEEAARSFFQLVQETKDLIR